MLTVIQLNLQCTLLVIASYTYSVLLYFQGVNVVPGAVVGNHYYERMKEKAIHQSPLYALLFFKPPPILSINPPMKSEEVPGKPKHTRRCYIPINSWRIAFLCSIYKTLTRKVSQQCRVAFWGTSWRWYFPVRLDFSGRAKAKNTLPFFWCSCTWEAKHPSWL